MLVVGAGGAEEFSAVSSGTTDAVVLTRTDSSGAAIDASDGLSCSLHRKKSISNGVQTPRNFLRIFYGP